MESMKINLNLLNRLSDRFGVGPISKVPQLQKILAHPEVFIKAPAGFEPLITGGGYQWDDDIAGYKLGENQKIFLLPDGKALWVFKNALFRVLIPNSIPKWTSSDAEYPMGKANAFFIIYGKLTGQDLGQNETAGDDIPDGEQDADEGGGVAAADDENAPKFTKQDIQKMLAGGWPDDAGEEAGPSMDTAVPGSDPTGLADEPSGPAKGPMPDRTKVGVAKPVGSEADQIIKTIYKKAKVDTNAKLSKQNPIRLDYDEIIDFYNRAKTLPPEEGKKLIAFLKSGIVIPGKKLEEGKMLTSQLQALVEHIVEGVVCEVEGAKKRWTIKLKKEQTGTSAASPVTGPNAFNKKDEPLEEMTTTSGGGDSSPGTPGYQTPGAWSGGSLKKNKKHIEVLGYKLTPAGKAEMNRAGDNLYENTNTTPGFDRAQQQYDTQLPPEDDNGDGIECPECGSNHGYVTDKGHKGSAYWIQMKCGKCGSEWGHDNFDALDNR